MILDFDKKLAELGFAPIEIEAVTLVLTRMGLLPTCEHTRPRFIKCHQFDDVDIEINEMRWQQFMQFIGFHPDAITLAEHAIFGAEAGRS